MSERLTRADYLLAENIRTLIAARGVDAGDVAMATGHGSSWISKVLNGDRGMRVVDVGKVAAYFGLTIAELFSPGISAVTERRRVSRRSGNERRRIEDRRKNFVTQSPTDRVEHSRPAHQGGSVYVDGDSDPATLEISAADFSVSELDRAISHRIKEAAVLQRVRERALASLTRRPAADTASEHAFSGGAATNPPPRRGTSTGKKR